MEVYEVPVFYVPEIYEDCTILEVKVVDCIDKSFLADSPALLRVLFNVYRTM